MVSVVLRTLVTVGFLAAVAGCSPSVSVSASGGGEERYLSIWERDWAIIEKHAQPLLPTESSPGVCNRGGSKALCHDTAQVLLKDFERLSNDLRGSWIPDVYRTPTQAIQEAISRHMEALRLRIVSLEAPGDQAAWQRANQIFRESHALFVSAYELFPLDRRPTPPPFV
jgi:hypothetical protein